MPELPMTDVRNSVDRVIHAYQGRLTHGFAPASMLIAYLDWLVHLLNSPGKVGEMLENASVKGRHFSAWMSHAATDADTSAVIKPLPQDRRFSNEAWQRWPFSPMYQGFLMAEQWWHYATTAVPGVSKHHEDMVAFGARQLLDVFSPSNFPWTNPEVIQATIDQGGANLQRGLQRYVADLQEDLSGQRMKRVDAYPVGAAVAITPGKVVYRNRLIELLQYEPTTPKVRPEPILIVPAWIMKYYILDLSPHNSLVKYLVDQGYTVFMISWKNPGREDRDLRFEDYLKLGIMQALHAVSAIVPDRKIHAAGYCLGGTLLAIAAAAMARDGDDRLQSVSLFTAQTDFSEPGELKLFIDEGQLAFMEDVMWEHGYLDNTQMAGVFQLLRSNDLIWSRMVREYLLGEPGNVNDLMAWNSDTTRMPYRMHAQYLRQLFLHNDLAAGRFHVDDRPIVLSDIRTPIFMVSTTKDHVAPWRSVYKAHLLVDTELTFVLTTGGHNAGIVSEPGHPRRSYQMRVAQDQEIYMSPDDWLAGTPTQQGSWWPAWQEWLAQRSGRRVNPPAMGAPESGYLPRGDAPGEYVLIP